MLARGEGPLPGGFARYAGNGFCDACATRKARGGVIRAFRRSSTTYLMSNNPTPICAREDVNTDWWYPEDKWGVDIAKWLCSICPVLEQCRTDALSTTAVNHGIVGGMSRTERNAKRKQQRRLEAA